MNTAKFGDSKQDLLNTLNQFNNNIIHDRDYHIFNLFKNKAPIIIDIGANRGQSIASFLTIFPNSQIHSFEANLYFFPILDELSSRLNSNVTIHKHGLGSQNGTLKFYVPKIGPNYYLEEASLNIDSFNKSWIKQKYQQREMESGHQLSFDIINVNITRLDTIQIPDPDIIKIDVEGAELDVLKGAELILKNCNPVLLIENSDWHNVTEYLKHLKYDCYRLDPEEVKLVSMYGATTNCLYIKQNSLCLFDNQISRIDYTDKPLNVVFQQQLHNFGFNDFYINGYLREKIIKLGGLEAWVNAESLENFCELSSTCAGFARYALSTLWRGENIFNNLSSFLTASHHRLLDVGCGFGGSLVAFGKRGFEVSGIELDSDRATATEILLKDQNLIGHISNMDIYSDSFNSFEEFDIIIAENVIEHVDNPRKFLFHLSKYINPNGILYLEIPNYMGVQYVSCDPHYQIPLITLLRHHSAKAAFKSIIGSYNYDIGEYYNLSWYLNILQTLGYVVTWKPHPLATRSIEQFHDLFVQITKKITEIDKIYENCDIFVADELKSIAWRYLAKVAGEYKNYHDGKNNDFVNYYLADAWILIAQKPR